MRSEVLVVCLLGSLPLCLAGPPLCSCNGYINSKGQGECQTTYRGKQFCYVDKGNCNDQKKGTYSYRYWSYEACKNYHTYGLECYGLKGDRCQFPFKWDGRTFNNCTTYKSANGAAWCATRVRGKDREAVRGSLEDCSAPCDHGASPYEDCPRNPVVKGRSRDCCTPESDPAGLEKVTATATLTVDTDSSVGTVTVHSSDLTTMPGQTAVTTLNIPTTEKVKAYCYFVS